MRKRVVKMDGFEAEISPLTIAQVEEHMKELDAVLAEKPMDKEKMRVLWRRFIATGLNNALADGAARWTEDRIDAELDLLLFARLRDEITEFSGLKIDERQSSGEARAAS